MNCVDAGNVFVHLFLQTKKRYVLTNRKLQYLLIVAQMACLAQGRALFDEGVRNFKHGFGLDVIADSFVSNTAIFDGTANDAPLPECADSFVLPFSKKRIYHIENLPSEADRQVIVEVFLAFGAYKEETLCRMLNGFGPLRKTAYFKEASKERIERFLANALDKGLYAGNVVLEFVAEQCSESSIAAEPPEQALHEVVAASTGSESVAAGEVPCIASDDGFVETEAPLAQASAVCAEGDGATEDVSAPFVDELDNNVPACAGVLKDVPSLQSVVLGRKYTVLFEVPSSRQMYQVSVLAPALNQVLPGVLQRLSDTLYSFTFEGVASDIQISLHPIV